LVVAAWSRLQVCGLCILNLCSVTLASATCSTNLRLVMLHSLQGLLAELLSTLLLLLTSGLAAACLAALQALAVEQAAAEAEARRQAEDTAHRLQLQAEKAALVAPELPADSDVPHLTLLFRLPDGSRLSRRFGLQQQLQQLYDYVDSKVGALKLRVTAADTVACQIASVAQFCRVSSVCCSARCCAKVRRREHWVPSRRWKQSGNACCWVPGT
jgi:hypothetical protein